MANVKRVVPLEQNDDADLRAVAAEIGITPTALCRILIRAGLRHYRTNGRVELLREQP